MRITEEQNERWLPDKNNTDVLRVSSWHCFVDINQVDKSDISKRIKQDIQQIGVDRVAETKG